MDLLPGVGRLPLGSAEGSHGSKAREPSKLFAPHPRVIPLISRFGHVPLTHERLFSCAPMRLG